MAILTAQGKLYLKVGEDKDIFKGLHVDQILWPIFIWASRLRVIQVLTFPNYELEFHWVHFGPYLKRSNNNIGAFSFFSHNENNSGKQEVVVWVQEMYLKI